MNTRQPYRVNQFTPIEERLWGRLDKTGDCWLWTGAINEWGYGVIDYQGKFWRVHRLAYTLAKGRITDGLDVLHRCDIRVCANPEHLFLGDAFVNMQDMVTKGRHWNGRKTHCPRGHEYTPENTRVWGRKRYCKTCEAMRWRGSRPKSSASV